jgi:hypothetical protein
MRDGLERNLPREHRRSPPAVPSADDADDDRVLVGLGARAGQALDLVAG